MLVASDDQSAHKINFNADTMRTSLIAFVVAVCTLTAASAQSQSFELEYLGAFKLPTADWEVLEEKSTSAKNKLFAFTILRNKSTGDLLSFAVYDKPGPELLTLVDSAHEIFPDGHFNVPLDGGFTISSLKWGIVNRRDQQVLEYSFVAEHKITEKNRLAHGSVLVGDKTIFIQHTSQRPVAPELAQEVAGTVLRRLVAKSHSANLKKSK